MRARLPASERTSQRIEQLMNALEQSEENATFSKLAMRKVIEELLEAEVADRLGGASTSGPRARAKGIATAIGPAG